MNMQSYTQYKQRTPHDPILTGNNASYMALGYFPIDALESLLPPAMSIPPDDAINSNEYSFANYTEYSFTTSQAMRYDKYFQPTAPAASTPTP